MPQEPNNTVQHSTTALVDQYLNQAIDLVASDIHIEPGNKHILIRMRIDGIMREVEQLPLHLLNNLVSRIKVLAKLDISETRQPQDGRFEMHRQQPIDLRVSIFPTIYGECVVIRILDQSRVHYSFEDLGLEHDQQQLFTHMIHRPYGLMLVTGPTGSGKTTTLFSILSTLNSTEKCLVTLEDPVEYHLPLVRQTQVDTRIDFGFAEGLRSLFRQNPDIIMVGEIRDQKTAEIAIQAAMTGHLVLSTLHTNDATSALIRLREMNLEKFMITSATTGIIAQRLVRMICPDCKIQDQPPQTVIKMLRLENEQITYYKGSGCTYCHASGYRGRTGIFEILKPSAEINDLVYKDSSWQDLYEIAKKQGMHTLRQNGIAKVKDGITTLEEIIRVTQ